jgi:hypothetical protein
VTLVVAECCLLPPRRGPGRGRRWSHGGRPVATMHATGQREGASRDNPCGQPHESQFVSTVPTT